MFTSVYTENDLVDYTVKQQGVVQNLHNVPLCIGEVDAKHIRTFFINILYRSLFLKRFLNKQNTCSVRVKTTCSSLIIA